MSLYDKATIVQIPSGVKSGTLYNVLPNTADGDFDFTRATTATRVNKDGLIESVASGVPRLNYPLTNGVVGSCPSLLLENLATNEIDYSENFSQWTNAGSTDELDNSVVAPDGSSGVYKIAPDATNANHSMQKLNRTISGGTVVFSVFAKAGTERYVRLRMGNTTNNPRVWFDLQTGVVENEDVSGSGSIENYGNGWYRLIVTNTANVITSTTGQAQIFIQSASSASTIQTSYTGDPNQHIYVWGAQFENSEHITSYIPTSGSAVTKNADQCIGAGTSAEFNDSEGVLFIEMKALIEGEGTRAISISNSTTDERIMIRLTSTDGEVNFQVRTDVGGTPTNIVNAFRNITNTTQYNKIALKYKADDMALWANGVELATPSGSSTPTGLSELAFDDGNLGNRMYAEVKQVMVFNEALTDAELTTLTS